MSEGTDLNLILVGKFRPGHEKVGVSRRLSSLSHKASIKRLEESRDRQGARKVHSLPNGRGSQGMRRVGLAWAVATINVTTASRVNYHPPRSRMPRAWAIALVLVAVRAPADEVVRKGEVVRGTLVLNAGRLELHGADGKVSAGGAGLGRVTLASANKTFPAGPGHVVALSAEERITGVFLGMEKDRIALRTVWADRVLVPKAGLVSLMHLPGWRTLIREDFGGKPTRVPKAGQAIEVRVTSPLRAGQIGVLFQESDRPTGAKWVVEAVFADRTVRVTLAGAGDALAVDVGGLEGTAYPVKRSSEARKLTVAFSGQSLRIACDDEALWHSPTTGPGALRQVRLVCVATDGKATGAVLVSGVVVEAAEAVRRRPAGDPTRDELWLASGDQLFGEVKRADAVGVEIAGLFGTRSYAWKELRGWFPRRSAVVAAKAPQGVRVRVEIHSGLRAEPDVLDGVLTALDAKAATIHHPRLGALTIPRARVATVKPLAEP